MTKHEVKIARQKKPGQTPGSMHIDKRARRLLDDHIAEGSDDELLTTEQVAEWFGCSVQFLEILRGRDDGPDFERLAPKLVRYRRGAVRSFLRQREMRSTTQYRKKSGGKALAAKGAER